MVNPIIHIENLYKSFPSGESSVDVLKDINLDIYPGELVAIVGQSGSGKSTLMNIIGCLDQPSKGLYEIAGQKINELLPDELAQLRREYFGFIFQRYQLLTSLSALENVELPAIYTNSPPNIRKEKATEILSDLGLGERIHHKPGQLSGGQQQRVSIARALINGGDVILADEPTGALDSNSGKEVIEILKKLNQQGHTIIIVTHDMSIAKKANRIIEIKDGIIISDQPNQTTSTTIEKKSSEVLTKKKQNKNFIFDLLKENTKMAIRSIFGHKLRAILTMLGIIIGIASVVSMVALGKGTQANILETLGKMGTNTITIYKGVQGDRPPPEYITTLRLEDVDALAKQKYIESATPWTSTNLTITYSNKAVTGRIIGGNYQYFSIRNIQLIKGSFFNQKSEQDNAQEAVIDEATVNTFFPHEDPIGKVINVGALPIKIIGVGKSTGTLDNGGDTPTIWLPYTTVTSRFSGQQYLNVLIVKPKESISVSTAREKITQVLTQRHGKEDFTLTDFSEYVENVIKTTSSMSLFISFVAIISLFVGGIGVMNIMLVSVTERTQEIGVRMAVGARQNDIKQQFLVESIILCLSGGLIGVILSFTLGVLMEFFILSSNNSEIRFSYSFTVMFIAFIVSTLIGVIFGFIPAKNAAKLDPVKALSRE